MKFFRFVSTVWQISLWQIENEYGNIMGPYGEAGKKYVQWCANTAESLKVGVPWIMCQQNDAPQPMVSFIFQRITSWLHHNPYIHNFFLSFVFFSFSSRSTHAMDFIATSSHRTIPTVLRCGLRTGLAGEFILFSFLFVFCSPVSSITEFWVLTWLLLILGLKNGVRKLHIEWLKMLPFQLRVSSKRVAL